MMAYDDENAASTVASPSARAPAIAVEIFLVEAEMPHKSVCAHDREFGHVVEVRVARAFCRQRGKAEIQGRLHLPALPRRPGHPG